MRFPPEFIDRLRNHLPLSQVVGKRVPVKRHGREFHGLCPFHKEKSPSFTVNDEKGFFHCFGCAAHGDAIGFIKDYEGVSYVEAVERLAAEAGLPVPEMTVQAREQARKLHTMEDTMAAAAEWFTQQLHEVAGQEAREYLAHRGMSRELMERFGLGYAAEGRENLKAAMARRGISEAMMVEAGLLAKRDDGSTYNRFRERLIFPIRNARGSVVAFGGRLLPSAQAKHAAKYLNSPETPLFRKGEMLFAYDIAAKKGREEGRVTVCEGYMDVIAMHQAGFETAVAPLGTAITEQQLQLLWRIAPEPVLCLDGDAAGMRAMKRAAQLSLAHVKPGFSLRFAALPGGEDPDSLIAKSGTQAMRQALSQAKVLSTMLWESAVRECGVQTVEKMALLEQRLMQTADAIADAKVKQHMRDYFREQLFALKRSRKALKPALPEVRPGAVPDAEDRLSHLIPLEEHILAIVILYPSIVYHADIEEHFSGMDYTQPLLDKLRVAVLEITSAAQSIDHASLCVALAERGFSEKVKTLLYSNNRVLPAGMRNAAVESSQLALQAFEIAYSAYTDKKLEYEIKEAVNLFERDMSEQNQSRLFALQKQREELQRGRYVHMSEE